MIKSILIIDNNPVILKFMDNFFIQEGYRVRTAVDGISALNVLETYTPDLIFIDLIMPNIQGDKLCKLIRSMPQFVDTYLVIVSAAAMEIAADVEEWGANGCIAKGPFDEMRHQFRQVVAQFSTTGAVGLPYQPMANGVIAKRHITEEFIALQKHFGLLFENITDGIVEIHSSGRIVAVNDVACKWFSLPEDQVLAQVFFHLFNVEDQDRIKSLLLGARQAPQEISRKFPIVVGDRFLTMKFVPLSVEGMTSIVAIIHDITRLKNEEEAHLKVINELQQAMAEIKKLSGLLPVCSSCKRIRVAGNKWQDLDRFIQVNTDAKISHTICPDCTDELYPELADN